MGRIKKYKTHEEKINVMRKWRREYYHRNKKIINEKRMQEYYNSKNMGEKMSKL
jgi:hypothetical protein